MLDDPNFQRFLSVHANHRDERPVAVFDCDGTVIKGDIGEAMLFYQLEHFHFLLSPGEIWKDHPKRRELNKAYGELADADPATRRGHPAFEPFAHLVLEWYFGQIAAGKVEKACADIVRLLSGYSAEEVRVLAEATFLQESSAPLSERNLGGYGRPLGIRYIVESVKLLKTLQEKGFDIWVISGSNRWSVESVFRRLGVESDRVIGIDLEDDGGTLTDSVIHPVPVRENKVKALAIKEPRVPVLVASDSRNDVPLFLYSSDLKVYVNSRRKVSAEFFQGTTIVRDNSWIVIEHPTLKE